MKYRLLLILIVSGLAFELHAQEESVQNAKVVVNKAMIERFNSVNTDGGLYSWSQLINAAGSQNLREVLLSYRDCDINTESLQSISLALKEKTGYDQEVPDSETEEYIAFINRAKQEIREKLAVESSVAMK